EQAGNRDLFLNMVNWLAGEEEKISIRPRSTEREQVVLTGGQAKMIFYFATLIFPAAVIILGGGIWMRRRNL
ncbi:MAG: ABC transporter, partial [bacterium]